MRWPFSRRPATAADDDLEDELRFHLEQEAARLEQTGVAPAEARRLARVKFGGLDRIVEETRTARPQAWLESAARDVRLAVRGLRRDGGFAVVAVLTLAVGLGATTAVFALANSLLLRPVPGVRAADELVVVQFSPEPGLITLISHRNIEDVRAAVPALAGVTGYGSPRLQARPAGGEALEVAAHLVEGDYFGTLGLRPRLGRWFTPEERAPHAAGDVAVISHRLWTSRLGGATDVIGSRLQLNAVDYTIVGVAPPGFHGTDGSTHVADVWLPPAAHGRLRHRTVDVADRGAAIFQALIGRLAPGATPELAQQQLRAAMAALVEQYPDVNEEYATYLATVHAGVGLPVSLRAPTARTLRLLLGVVSLLLVIACANVANLLLFRGVTRRGEVAVRRALGASAGQLVQQHMVEGLVLAVAGSAVGLVIALLISGLFAGQGLHGRLVLDGPSLDARVAGFALACSLLTGVLFALAPAAAALRGGPAGALHDAGRRATGSGAAVRSGLTIVQVAASLALLVGSLMLIRSVQGLGRVHLGLDTGVYAFGFTPAPQGYDAAAARELRQRLLEEVAALPGIRSASVASFLPVGNDGPVARITVPGSGAEPVRTWSAEVSADYFTTVGTRILAGRGFTRTEERAPVTDGSGIVLSESAARALFGDADAVGRVVDVAGMAGLAQQVVIGVAEDVRRHPRMDPFRSAYLPLSAATMPHAYVLVRSSAGAAGTRRLVADALARLDPNIPFFSAESLGDVVRTTIAEERLLARLLTLFALLAVTLAGIGLYGVVAYGVARRRREIGIRMALGARAAAVIALVARQSLALLAVGAVLGVAGGYALSRVLASRMFGVTPLDPLTYAAAVVGFALVAALASAVPARTAARVDPMNTLRLE